MVRGWGECFARMSVEWEFGSVGSWFPNQISIIIWACKIKTVHSIRRKLTGKTNAHHFGTPSHRSGSFSGKPFQRNSTIKYSTLLDAILFYFFLSFFNGFFKLPLMRWCCRMLFAAGPIVVFCLCAFWFQLRIFSHIMWKRLHVFDCESVFPLAVPATPLHRITTNITYEYIEFAHVTRNWSEDGVDGERGGRTHQKNRLRASNKLFDIILYFLQRIRRTVGRCWQNRHFGYVPWTNHFYQ